MMIKIRAVPRAKKERVEVFGDGLKIYFSEPAIEGKANKKIIDILAKHYNAKKRDVVIIKGQKQRDKVVQISEVD